MVSKFSYKHQAISVHVYSAFFIQLKFRKQMCKDRDKPSYISQLCKHLISTYKLGSYREIEQPRKVKEGSGLWIGRKWLVFYKKKKTSCTAQEGQ